ncbi:hypothetical protein [Streptomyces sp. NPDC059906]|uniref:hypothetical protein n=1 Tax=Streptomyces sp. NPDC059906 TaxID=3346997 RepID=UPI0036619E51
MTDVEVLTRTQTAGGHPVERLVCHPRLPLFACLDSERPAVTIWTCDAGQLRELGSVGTDSVVYSEAFGWKRSQQTPAVAWHPSQSLLVVASEGRAVQWEPSGLTSLESLPPGAGYTSLAFSPDGRAMWASPPSDGEDDAWDRSDILDLDSGSVSTGPRWDTGVTEHPGGGLVTMLASDQGATLTLFARAGTHAAPAGIRLLRHALILDADGYETPIFSPDGRLLAIRGNAYGNSLDVFEFPSLRRVFATSLGEPSPGYPYPQEWLDQMRAWSRHNVAFGIRPAVLWVGTPAGALIEVDTEAPAATEHDLPGGAPVSALGRTATGELVIATDAGDLALLSVDPASTRAHGTNDVTAQAAVAAFVNATSEVPDAADLGTDLVLTDGASTWDSGDLATVNTASATDPTWLQLQAAINDARDQDK